MNVLPFNMKVAAYADSLDKVKMVPDCKENLSHVVWVFATGDWENRLVNECVKRLNADIDAAMNNRKQGTIYIETFGGNYRIISLLGIPLYVKTEMRYLIKTLKI